MSRFLTGFNTLSACIGIVLLTVYGGAGGTDWWERSLFKWLGEEWRADLGYAVLWVAGGALLWHDRRALGEVASPPNPWALLGLLPALALYAVGWRMANPVVSCAAAICATWFAVFYLRGFPVARATFWPCLLFILGTPDLLSPLVSFLRNLAIHSAVAASSLFKLPLQHHANSLFTTGPPELIFEVGSACSGARSLLVILAGAVVILAVIRELRPIHSLALILIAITLGLLVNVFRVFSLLFVARWYGQETAMHWHDTTLSGAIPCLLSLWLLVKLGGWCAPPPRRM